MFGRVVNGVVLIVALLTLVACSAVPTQTQPQQPEAAGTVAAEH